MRIRNLSIIIYFFVVACATTNKRHQLSRQEMKQYHLNGVINDVKICPMIFDEPNKVLKVNGQCELVSCELKDKDIICWAQMIQ